MDNEGLSDSVVGAGEHHHFRNAVLEGVEADR